MSRMDVKVKQGRVQLEKTELVVLTHFQGNTTLQDEAAQIDKRLQGALQGLVKSGEFEGNSIKQSSTMLRIAHRLNGFFSWA